MCFRIVSSPGGAPKLQKYNETLPTCGRRGAPHSSANAPVAEGSFTGNGVVSALPRTMTFLCVPSPRTTICSKHSWPSLTCSPSRRILPSPHIEEHMEPASEAEQSDRASASSLTPGTAGSWQTPGTAGAWLSAPGTSGAWPLGGISSASPNCTLLFFCLASPVRRQSAKPNPNSRGLSPAGPSPRRPVPKRRLPVRSIPL